MPEKVLDYSAKAWIILNVNSFTILAFYNLHMIATRWFRLWKIRIMADKLWLQYGWGLTTKTTGYGSNQVKERL